MIYEMRIYTIRPADMARYMDIVTNVGMPIRGDDYGILVGAWTSDVGPLNRYYHLWSYPSAGERERIRAGLATLPGWLDRYVASTRGMVLAQHNELWYADPDVGVRPVESKGNVYELRSYRTLPGDLGAWLAPFKGSLAQREKHSQLVGLWTGEVGGLSAGTHLWVYRDGLHRSQVRQAVAADEEIRRLRAGELDPVVEQTSTLLVPTSFSKLG